MTYGYFDWAATALPEKDILLQSAEKAYTIYGNPSSIHTPGKKARELIEECRIRCAEALGCPGNNVFFTGGGTEANNLAVLSLLQRPRKGHIITSMVEHPSVYGPVSYLTGQGFTVTEIPAETSGIIDPDVLGDAVGDDTFFAAVMGVNNETGAVQPVKEIGEILRHSGKRKIHLHCDAVQAAGKTGLAEILAAADTVTVSAHKLGGPRGAGILVSKQKLDPVLTGGGQERGIRPGTENLQGIYGMTLALEKALREQKENRIHTETIEKQLISGIREIEGSRMLPKDRQAGDPRYSPYIITAAFPPVPGEVLLRVLNDEGFQVSTGSACSSRKRDYRVLRGSGADDQTAGSAIRVSTGPGSSPEETAAFLSALKHAVETLR
ncbi:MAG: cysteine desulfurase family protein [Spirochaetia bacterium]